MNKTGMIVALVIRLATCGAALAETPASLLVIRAAGQTFDETIRGMTGELDAAFAISEFIVTTATTDSDIAGRITTTAPAVIVLMDNRAIDLYKSYQQKRRDSVSVPALALMGISVDHAIRGCTNTTGISYEIPIVTSMVNLRSVLKIPIKKVGIIHRRFLDDFIRRNRPFCAKEEFELVEFVMADTAIINPSMIKKGLDFLLKEKKVDAIWVPNDNAILTPDIITGAWAPVLSRSRIPAVVGVEVLVRPELDMGTFAVLPDHAALGQQAAARIFDISTNGWKTDGMRVQPPISVIKVVNGDRAQRLFGIGPAALSDVDKVLTPSDSGVAAVTLRVQESSQEDLSLGDLLNMQVTSVAKKAERMMDVATSIYVITEDDIKRTGATRVTDLLDMVPGLWNAYSSYSSINTAIRNWEPLFCMTVNILVDGMPVVNQVVGGMSWEGLTVPVDQIERIEVIKGPGGTIYGANSTTGIINIITKNAKHTQGFMADVKSGNRSYIAPFLRYGFSPNDKIYLSAFASASNHAGYGKDPGLQGDIVTATNPDGTTSPVQNRLGDTEDGHNTGFVSGVSVFMELSPKITLSGSGYYQFKETKGYTSLKMPNLASGIPQSDSVWMSTSRWENAHVNCQLDYSFSKNHAAFVHAYWYDYINFLLLFPSVGRINPSYWTGNLELQDNFYKTFNNGSALDLTYGANTRAVVFEVKKVQGPTKRLFPETKDTAYVVAAFIQGKISLVDLFHLTTGFKAETWTLIGNKPEISPTVRLSCTPGTGINAWGAWSRGVTMPGYMHKNVAWPVAQLPSPSSFVWQLDTTWASLGLPRDSVAPAGAGKWITLVGSAHGLKPASYYSTETGLRIQPTKFLFLDFSGYYTQFKDDIISATIHADSVIPSPLNPQDSIVPTYWRNGMYGFGCGTECVVRFLPVDFCKLDLSYAYNYWRDQLSQVDVGKRIPRNVIRLRSYLDLPLGIQLYIGGTWHGKIKGALDDFNYVTQQHDLTSDFRGAALAVPAEFYLDFSIRKSFFNNKFSISIWGRDMLYGSHHQAYIWSIDPYPQTVGRLFGIDMSYYLYKRHLSP